MNIIIDIAQDIATIYAVLWLGHKAGPAWRKFKQDWNDVFNTP